MSWSRRRALLLGPGLLLAGCGFQPLYGGRGKSGYDADLASIKVGIIADRLGQLLAISLRDAFNPTNVTVPTHYILDVLLIPSRADLGIRADATASRSEVTIVAVYKLTEVKTNKLLLNGTTRSVSAFDVLNDDYATTIAQQNAELRSLDYLADDLRERVMIFVRQRRSTAGAS